MKKLAIACALFASAAFAAEPPMKAAGEVKADMKAAGAEVKADMKANPMAGWEPRKVTKKDDKGVDALYTAMEASMKKGDVEACAALHDFPVFMLTDNKAGVTSGDWWTKETWMAVMKPAMENMPKDAKHSMKKKVEFLTDSIAVVVEDHKMEIGKTKMEYRSSSTLVLKDGKWMMKAGVEGGWGDMMAQKGASK